MLYSQVIREDLPKLTNPNRPKAEAPPHLRIPPATPISKYINVFYILISFTNFL